jgi:hypothetical protein
LHRFRSSGPPDQSRQGSWLSRSLDHERNPVITSQLDLHRLSNFGVFS